MSFQFILSQILYAIGQLILIRLMFVKTKKSVEVMTIFFSISFAISYYLLGSASGTAMSVILALFALIELYVLQGKLPKTIKSWADKLVYLPIFALAYLFYDDPTSLLPVIGTILNFTSISLNKTINIKSVLFLANLFFYIYNFYLNNISGIVIGSIILIMNILGIFAELRRKKNTKNNNINP